MARHKELPTFELGTINSFVERGDSSEITLDSPASAILTDFTKTRPLVIDSDATIDEAELLMKKAHVHSKFVMDAGAKILGIVTSMDLVIRPLKVAAAMGIKRSELTVKDVMTPLIKLHALRYDALSDATIGDVINTLQDLGERHVIVADPAESTIRGVISATEIARKLHVPIDIAAKATNFADVYDVISKS